MYASAISKEINFKSNFNTKYNLIKAVLMPHLQYFSSHNLYLQAALQHILQGPKHLQSPPLPVAFLFFLHQCCVIV